MIILCGRDYNLNLILRNIEIILYVKLNINNVTDKLKLSPLPPNVVFVTYNNSAIDVCLCE